MALRIGIDVGGTFTHGVVLRPPGEVLARARVPTTHADARGVAAGVEQTLHALLEQLPQLGYGPADIELVAHSTTQATNALLEGDLSGVHLLALVPPGERALVSRALRQRRLDIGGGHSIRLWPKLLHDWDTATPENFPAELDDVAREHAAAPIAAAAEAGNGAEPLSTLPEPTSNRPGWEGYGIPPGFRVSSRLPVAVVQPLAGKYEPREQYVAAHYRASGHPAVCAGEITQVLGLQARARTAVVNAAMLPTMLATADYTQAAVEAVLPGVPLQVVRSDGGAMSIDEMRRQPILSLLSGPAAGASAALHRSGLANAVFIEVGGTSTDITLIKDGRVRHRSATVGGQRLMVPALDLRTVAVGGGSMLRADKPLFGPRSAHIAGLPYLFQALQEGLTVKRALWWADGHGVVDEESYSAISGSRTVLRVFTDLSSFKELYHVIEMSDGSYAAPTLTDSWLWKADSPLDVETFCPGVQLSGLYDQFIRANEVLGGRLTPHTILETMKPIDSAIQELVHEHESDLGTLVVLAGGGAAPVIEQYVLYSSAIKRGLIPDHEVISAIGAALAVTCVSMSVNVAEPGAGDIAELTTQVEARLAAQGAERVSTDYEFDPRRQVLTVTGRGSRPYDRDAQLRSEAELAQLAAEMLGGVAEQVWDADGLRLWVESHESRVVSSAESQPRTAAALTTHDSRLMTLFKRRPTARLAGVTDAFGRVLWQGRLGAHVPVQPGGIGAALDGIVARYTAHTDGGAVLPGLALLAAGRFIPLDSLGSAELVAEVLRWENLPTDAAGCFLIRS